MCPRGDTHSGGTQLDLSNAANPDFHIIQLIFKGISQHLLPRSDISLLPMDFHPQHCPGLKGSCFWG